MTTPKRESPLIPASLAADGMQGADAKADGHCGAQHSPQDDAALFLARLAVEVAQAQLDAYALVTDDPHPGTVKATDLLDAARSALGGAP